MLFGLLGKRKDNDELDETKLPKNLITFLNKADEEYMRAFARRSTKALQDFMSRGCAVKVSQSVFSINSRYFGAEKFRNTTWTKVEACGDVITICKEVLFDRVRVGGSMYINVSDDYTEHWVVDISEKSKPVVTDIIKIK